MHLESAWLIRGANNNSWYGAEFILSSHRQPKDTCIAHLYKDKGKLSDQSPMDEGQAPPSPTALVRQKSIERSLYHTTDGEIVAMIGHRH